MYKPLNYKEFLSGLGSMQGLSFYGYCLRLGFGISGLGGPG